MNIMKKGKKNKRNKKENINTTRKKIIIKNIKIKKLKC